MAEGVNYVQTVLGMGAVVETEKSNTTEAMDTIQRKGFKTYEKNTHTACKGPMDCQRYAKMYYKGKIVEASEVLNPSRTFEEHLYVCSITYSLRENFPSKNKCRDQWFLVAFDTSYIDGAKYDIPKSDDDDVFVYVPSEFVKHDTNAKNDGKKKSTLQHWINTTLSAMAEISEQVVSARDD
ncbi:unnamed protein product [Strongylus vulgaris]|uniref:Uncharacterized protein n=1 Tax=Strongylus vulgaris TaxID=40348 RepID=A0A3P7L7D9_STRVU|nr:unnamed protein product [Strongylus vulgaris]